MIQLKRVTLEITAGNNGHVIDRVHIWILVVWRFALAATVIGGRIAEVNFIYARRA